MKQQKHQSGSAHIIIVIILVLALASALGFVYWNNYRKNINNSTKTNNITSTSYKTYSVGDEVQVYLSGSNSDKFNVIADNGNTLTLFYQGVLASSPYYKSDTCYYVFDNYYNTNCENDYNSSTVKTNLKEATSAWSNPTEIRLITLNELLGLGTWTKTPLSGSGVIVYISSPDLPKWVLGSADPTLWKGYWASDADTENTLNEGYMQAWSVKNINYVDGGVMPRIDGSLVQDTLYMRPVITISKQYIK